MGIPGAEFSDDQAAVADNQVDFSDPYESSDQEETIETQATPTGDAQYADAGDQKTPEEDSGGEETSEAPGDDNTADGEWFDTDEVQEMARSYGIDAERLKTLGGPDKLEAAIDFLNYEMMKAGQQTIAPQQPQQPQYQQPRQQQPYQQQPQSASDQAAALAYQLNLSPDEIPEELITQIQAMNQHYATIAEQQFASLQMVAQHVAQQRAAFEQQSRGHQEAAYFAELDVAIGSLDSETQAFVKQGQNFNELDQAVRILAAGYQSRGIPLPGVKALVKSAVGLKFPDQLSQAARKQVTDELSKRSSRGSARPTRASGGKKPVTGLEKASQRVDRFFRSNAGELGDYDGDGDL